MNKAKIKKFIKAECAGLSCVVFTRETLEKLAALLGDGDELTIEPTSDDTLCISSQGNELIEIA